MSLAIGLLMILTGLAIMAFAVFYVLRVASPAPNCYWVGHSRRMLVQLRLFLGIAGAFILGVASYVLEPYRRVLLGVSGGILFGFSVATAFGLDGWFGGFFGRVLAIACGAVGGLLVPRFFDMFVIGASAVGSAAMAMTGVNHIFHRVGVFNLAAGGVLPSLVTIILALAGVSWQRCSITKWVQMEPRIATFELPGTDQYGPGRYQAKSGSGSIPS